MKLGSSAYLKSTCPLLKVLLGFYIINSGEIMKRIFLTGLLSMLLLISGLYSGSKSFTNEKTQKKDELIKKAAMEMIRSSQLCVLISTGMDGYPNARMMDPFPPDKNWVIWMGTNSQTRKVKEILRDNKISVFYESPDGDGYVTLKGTGFINNEKENKVKYFKEEWKEFYPADRKNFTLIKFIPELLEIVSYKKGLLGEKITWAAPSVKLKRY